MSAQCHPWVFIERRENPHTTVHAAARSEQHTQVRRNSCPYIYSNKKSILKVKIKQNIQRPEVPDMRKHAVFQKLSHVFLRINPIAYGPFS